MRKMFFLDLYSQFKFMCNTIITEVNLELEFFFICFIR